MLLVCDRGPLRVFASSICTEMARHPEATRIRRSVEEIAASGLTLAKPTVAANLLADLVKA
jgi:glutamate dehydrogenase